MRRENRIPHRYLVTAVTECVDFLVGGRDWEISAVLGEQVVVVLISVVGFLGFCFGSEDGGAV